MRTARTNLSVLCFAFLIGIQACTLSPDSKNSKSSPVEDDKTQDTVRFALLSDPHLFDSHIPFNKRQKPQGEVSQDCINKDMLKASIEKINQLSSTQSPFDFIAVAGDFGLELILEKVVGSCKNVEITAHGESSSPLDLSNIRFDGQDRNTEIYDELKKAAKSFANILLTSVKTKKWVFVNGNNDLCNEDSLTAPYSSVFMNFIQEEVGRELEVIYLQNDDTQIGTFRTHPNSHHVFVGFENGSFKNNHDLIYAEKNALHQENVLKSVLEKVNSLAGIPDTKVHLLFHAPHFDDPFNSQFSSNELPCEKRKPTNGSTEKGCESIAIKTAPGINESKPERHLYSVWLVKDNIRSLFDQIISHDAVKTLIAGHFHSGTRKSYVNFSAWQSENSQYLGLDKYVVSMPTSIKNQPIISGQEQARGFSVVEIDPQGARQVTQYWNDIDAPSSCSDIRYKGWTKNTLN